MTEEEQDLTWSLLEQLTRAELEKLLLILGITLSSPNSQLDGDWLIGIIIADKSYADISAAIELLKA